MRKAGYLNQLQQLIYHPEESVQITSLVALGNLALNKDNSKNMKVLIFIFIKKYRYNLLQFFFFSLGNNSNGIGSDENDGFR